MKHKSDIDEIFNSGLKKVQIEYKKEYWELLEPELKAGTGRMFLIKESVMLIIASSMIIGMFVSSSGLETTKNKPLLSMEQSYVERGSDSPSKSVENKIRSDSKLADETAMETRVNYALENTDKKSSTEQQERMMSEILSDPAAVQIAESDINNDEYGSKDVEHVDVQFSLPTPDIFDGIKSDKIAFETEFKPILEKLNPTFVQHYARLKWHINPYGEFQYYSRRLEPTQYSDEKSEEFTQSTAGYGIRVRLSKGPWSLVSGIGYSQIQEKVSYSREGNVVAYDSALRVVNWNFGITPSGTNIILVQWSYDSTVSTVNEPVCSGCITQFTYINIPLELQYELQIGRIRPFVGFGMNAGILMSAQGYYSTGSGISKINASDPALNRLLLSANGIAGIRTRIWRNIDLTASYQYRYGMSSMLNTYEQKPDMQLLRLGISIPVN